MLQVVLNKYGITKEAAEIKSFGTGLINNTWVINSGSNKYILQRINNTVFKDPAAIAFNIKAIGEYLSCEFPDYLFVHPIATNEQESMVYIKEEGYFRLFPFIKNSHTIDVVNTPSKAYEAAKQFARFSRLLSGFPAAQLHITLPEFHNLSLRYTQFETALQNGNKDRIITGAAIINYLKEQQGIALDYKKICANPGFKKRVTHHDTKISNVLFDEQEKGLCVIDLDTVMPGYFISDVGDMMRTYLSPVAEEEKDFSKIAIREDYFKAIAEGYLSEMNDELTPVEKDHFVYAGKFMIYMQALRFITDYINNDIYYGSKYEGHNFVRAENQVVLLQKLIEKEDSLKKFISSRK
jgi:Ser/Thr protein kinase RdoA (MazF antagonist)